MTSPRPLRCFIASNAAAGDEAARTAELLRELEVDAYRTDILGGQDIGGEIVAAIRAADFICVILGDGSPSPNLAFEVGLAIGLGKPVLALAIGPNVPFDLMSNLQIVRVPTGDVASVRRDIARFVRHVRPRPEATPAAGEQLTAWADAELDQLKETPSAGEREKRLVELVAKLFERQGSEVLSEAREGSRARLDLLVWSDPLVAEFGGPLIVECKYYGGGSGSVIANARHALEQLGSYVAQSSARLGLLVFDHDRPTELSLAQHETPEALAFFVRDLVSAVAAGSLTDEIWRRRSRAGRLQADRGEGS